MAIAAPQRIASAKGGPAKGDKTGSGSSTDDAGSGAKGGKSKKKLIIIAVAVLLLGGVGAKFTVLKPAASKVPPKPKEGAVIPLDEMTVNLQGGHFLRLQIALQATAKAGETVETAKAQQTIISIFSDRKMTELAGEKARKDAMQELVTELEKEYPDKIMGAYYTAFVMQ